MVDVSSELPKVRRSLPIFAKCMLILIAACTIVAGLLTYSAERGYSDIASFSIDTLAKSLTEVSADQVGGSLKFKDKDAIAQRLAKVVESTRMVTAFVVVGRDGQVVSSYPETISAEEQQALIALAAPAMEKNETTATDDGFSIAAPVHFGKKEKAVIGGLAIHWAPDIIFTEIADQRTAKIVSGIVVVMVLAALAGLLLRRMITTPLQRLSSRTAAMADDDLTSEIPGHTRGDEIGVSAQALESLRGKLEAAEVSRKDAAYQRAGFQASGTATIICDKDLKITHVNRAFSRFSNDYLKEFQEKHPEFDPVNIIGQTPDIFHQRPEIARQSMLDAKFPFEAELLFGEILMALTMNEVVSEEGELTGYVIEYSNATDERKTSAILSALEQAQFRADFDEKGRLQSLNNPFLKSLGIAKAPAESLRDIVADSQGETIWGAIQNGKPIFDKFTITTSGEARILDGGLSPVMDRMGNISGFVLLGNDVTAAMHDLKVANEEKTAMIAAQATVETALQNALTSLSNGDLKVRIDTEFSGDYEPLRTNFNAAVKALDDAIAEILESADTILSEADNVSTAADDLAKRTEHQAATLEETAAAISELSTSVSSAATGASNANQVVTTARENAETSGQVVQQAVDAMGEIENSSNQISRIIGVIDEIAFQTNLLALNAGVEAARAGDAGRGFAVVASEVRSLAQRSSEAAQEITDLISASGDHVRKGVSLVDKAGQALTEIVGSVGDIAEHVTAITVSSREQSTGLDEINTAMNQLDQVTQRNAAMFEETMAATQTVTAEANTLVGVTSRFDCNRGARVKAASAPAPTFESARSTPLAAENPKRTSIPMVTGNLAEAVQDEDWEEF